MYDNFDDFKDSYNDYLDSEFPYDDISLSPSVEDVEFTYGIASVFPEIENEYREKLRDPDFVNSEYFDSFTYLLNGLEHPEEGEIDFMVDMIVSEIENHIISKEGGQEIAENLFEFAKYGGIFYEKFLKETNQGISEFDRWRIDLKKRENELLRGEVQEDKVKIELFDSLVRTGAKISADVFRALTGAQDTSIFPNDIKDAYFIKQNNEFIFCMHTDEGIQRYEVNPNRLELFNIASAAKIVLKQHNEHLAQIDNKTFTNERKDRIFSKEAEKDMTKSGLIAKSYERVADKYSGPVRFLERTYIPDNEKRDPPASSAQITPVPQPQNNVQILTEQKIAEQNILYENQLPLIEVEINGIKTLMSQNEYDIFVDPAGNNSNSFIPSAQPSELSDDLFNDNFVPQIEVIMEDGTPTLMTPTEYALFVDPAGDTTPSETIESDVAKKEDEYCL